MKLESECGDSYSLHPLFQGESKCEAIEIRISVFIHIKIKINYHNKDFALRLALKKRLGGTWKWSIAFVLIVSIQRFDWLTVFAGLGSSGLNPLSVDGEVNCNSAFHFGERIQFLCFPCVASLATRERLFAVR